MKNVVVICEYNPFHLGHMAQLRFIKEYFYPEETCIICIMSPNFVQRGDIAVLQKYRRAQIAVECGASLVLELPFPFSIFSAEGFARSGIEIISRLANIDFICFGSECGDKERIVRTANNLLCDDFRQRLSKLTKSEFDISYASLREKLYNEMFGEPLLTSPNDILGVEYQAALNKAGCDINFILPQRDKRYSASRVRELIVGNNDNNNEELSSLVPDICYKSLKDNKCLSLMAFEEYLLTYFSLADPEYISKFYSLNFDMAHKMVSAAKKCASLESFITSVSDKRYTKARVRRAILGSIFRVEASYADMVPLYTTPLAFDEIGRKYLAVSSSFCRIPIITRKREQYSNKRALYQYETGQRADLLYNKLLLSKNVEVIKKPYSKN